MLLVDLGNSKIKYGLFDQSNKLIVASAELYSKDSLSKTIANKAVEVNASSIFISSVLNADLTAEFVKTLSSNFNVYLVETQKSYRGLSICYTSASNFGVDRWLALIALWLKFKSNKFLYLSAGSAMTVDLLSSGIHQGGYILPGVFSSFSALAKCDSLPQQVDLTNKISPSCTTESAIEAGVSRMYLSFLQNLESEYEDYQLFLSGGDAEALKSQFNLDSWQLVENLVLHGLEEVSKDKELLKKFLI